MKRFLLVCCACLALASCDDPQGAIRAAEAQGFTNVTPGGYSFTGCGHDDDFATKFTAKDARGRPISGVVCSGWFKGSTVRTY